MLLQLLMSVVHRLSHRVWKVTAFWGLGGLGSRMRDVHIREFGHCIVGEILG